MPQLPSDLTAGNLLSWQAGLERRLENELTKHTKTALSRVKDQALNQSLTAAFARTEWEEAVKETMAALELTNDGLEQELIDLALGDEAYDTAIAVMTLNYQSMSASRADFSAALDEALGLDTPSLSLTAAGAWLNKILRPAVTLGTTWQKRVTRTTRTAFTGLTGRLVLAEIRRRGHTGKRWVSRHDSKTRSSHLEADGQVRPIDLPFNVGGVDLDHPGQKGKPLEETANCRCVIVPAETSRR